MNALEAIKLAHDNPGTQICPVIAAGMGYYYYAEDGCDFIYYSDVLEDEEHFHRLDVDDLIDVETGEFIEWEVVQPKEGE